MYSTKSVTHHLVDNSLRCVTPLDDNSFMCCGMGGMVLQMTVEQQQFTLPSVPGLDFPTLKIQRQYGCNGPDYVRQVAVCCSPSGERRIITVGHERLVRCYSVDSGEETTAPLLNFKDLTWSAAAPVGRTSPCFVVGHCDSSVELYRIALNGEGKECLELVARTSQIRARADSMCFSPAGDQLLVCTDFATFLLDSSTLSVIHCFHDATFEHGTSCFSPDGRFIAACIRCDLPGSYDQVVRIRIYSAQDGGLVGEISEAQRGQPLMESMASMVWRKERLFCVDYSERAFVFVPELGTCVARASVFGTLVIFLDQADETPVRLVSLGDNRVHLVEMDDSNVITVPKMQLSSE